MLFKEMLKIEILNDSKIKEKYTQKKKKQNKIKYPDSYVYIVQQTLRQGALFEIKKNTCIKTKGSIYQEDITLLNVSIPNTQL